MLSVSIDCKLLITSSVFSNVSLLQSILCRVYPMLPVFLDCPFSCVVCSQCCLCFWTVHFSVLCVPNVASVSGLFIPLCRMYPMLPVFLDCPFLCVVYAECCQCFWIVHFSVSCVPNVASVSGLSILLCRLCLMLPVFPDCPFFCVVCTYCCQCFWIVHSSVSCLPNLASVSGLSIPLCRVYPMLPVILDCTFFFVVFTQCCQCFWIVHSVLLCVPNVASVSELFIFFLSLRFSLTCIYITICLIYMLHTFTCSAIISMMTLTVEIVSISLTQSSVTARVWVTRTPFRWDINVNKTSPTKPYWKIRNMFFFKSSIEGSCKKTNACTTTL